jgi:hypothetical protein
MAETSAEEVPAERNDIAALGPGWIARQSLCTYLLDTA